MGRERERDWTLAGRDGTQPLRERDGTWIEIFKIWGSKLKSSVTDIDQRNYIKIAVLQGKYAAQIHQELRAALGKAAYSERTVQWWVKQMKEGKIDVIEGRGGGNNLAKDQEERVKQVSSLLDQKRDWTMINISFELDIPPASVHRILTKDLQMKKIMVKWVPHLLDERQQEQRCESIRVKFNGKSIFD